MSKQIVNLTARTIDSEIEAQLETYPHYPYQDAFSIPDVRRKLISYVLNRVQSAYTVMEECDASQLDCDLMQVNAGKRDEIGAIVRQGIEQILADDRDTITHHIPLHEAPAAQASTWFG